MSAFIWKKVKPFLISVIKQQQRRLTDFHVRYRQKALHTRKVTLRCGWIPVTWWYIASEYLCQDIIWYVWFSTVLYTFHHLSHNVCISTRVNVHQALHVVWNLTVDEETSRQLITLGKWPMLLKLKMPSDCNDLCAASNQCTRLQNAPFFTYCTFDQENHTNIPQRSSCLPVCPWLEPVCWRPVPILRSYHQQQSSLRCRSHSLPLQIALASPSASLWRQLDKKLHNVSTLDKKDVCIKKNTPASCVRAGKNYNTIKTTAANHLRGMLMSRLVRIWSVSASDPSNHEQALWSDHSFLTALFRVFTSIST